MFEVKRTVVERAVVDDDEAASTFRLFIFGCFCMPLFLISILLYVIFAFIYLVKDYSVCNDRSTLWVHVLLVLLINTLQVAIQYSTTNDRGHEQDLHIKNIALLLGLNLVIVIYGAAVLFSPGVVCNDMRTSGLWVVANVMFWFAVVTTIFALILIAVAIYGYFTTGKAIIQRRRKASERRQSIRKKQDQSDLSHDQDAAADNL